MSKHESEVSTLLQNIAAKPVAINSTEIQKGIPEKLDSGRVVWTLGVCFLGLWSLGFRTIRHLNSVRLGPWTLNDWMLGVLDAGGLYAWNLDTWRLRLWTPGNLDYGRLGAWTLDPWS